jgi:putative ABC transport system ATP-binding protein
MSFEIVDLVVRKRSARTMFELAVPRLSIRKGEKLAIIGPSGSGKSTLLDALSMVLSPDQIGSFRLWPGGPEGPVIDVGGLMQRHDTGGLAAIRRRWLGYVLQTGGLLPFLTVRRNIEIGRRLLGLHDDGTVGALAERLGLTEHLRKLPAALSVGERQRVAIARALAHRPTIILADEPTAALDPANAGIVMSIFVELADQLGTTTIIASHDLQRVVRSGLRVISPTVEGRGSGVTRSVFAG